MRIIGFCLLIIIKYLAKLLYSFNVTWKTSHSEIHWERISCLIFLNHTSLFEPIYVAIAPNKFLWRISKDLIVPAAEETLNRPIVGKILKALIPGCVPISRKNDETWLNFLDQIDSNTLTAILPEGCMKRKTGLDKKGNPMTIKPGVADILSHLDSGRLLFVYSGGLHHIQAPGEKIPRIFKRVDVGLEATDIDQFKSQFSKNDIEKFRLQVINDLQTKLQCCDKI